MGFFIKALVALFTIVDPIGLVPVVIALTAGMPPGLRVATITRAVLIAAGVMAVFGVFGQQIFAYMGVTPEAFSIAGGALLFLVAIDMLFGRQSGARETERDQRAARNETSVAAFPLAIPMIAGPGTITTLILLDGSAAGRPLDLALIALAAVITLAAAWLAMLLSITIQKRIGLSGILVLTRVFGMLLAAVAAQFILNGIATFIAHLHP